MGTLRADRIWIYAGLAVIVLLAAGSWFLMINPKYAEADDIRDEVAAAELQAITLQKRVAKLKTDHAQLARFTAALTASRAALPEDSGVPDFLRQLQASGDRVGVDVNGVSVAAPAAVGTAAGVYEVPMTVSADGTATELSAFLVELQDEQPRAVLIDSATLTAQGAAPAADESTDADADPAGAMTLSLSLTAYVAPRAGAGVPTITTE